jgi:hypothetical protein
MGIAKRLQGTEARREAILWPIVRLMRASDLERAKPEIETAAGAQLRAASETEAAERPEQRIVLVALMEAVAVTV